MDTEDDKQEKMVPIDRLNTVIAERNQLKSHLSDLTAKQQQLQDSYYQLQTEHRAVEDYKSKYEQMVTQVETVRAQVTEERDLFQLGLQDAESIELARFYHQRLPTDGRPSIVDWLKQVQASPDDMPKPLRAVLGTPTRPVPNTNKAINELPASKPVLTPGAVSKLTMDEYTARRQELLKTIRAKRS